jgi:antitoxin YefM
MTVQTTYSQARANFARLWDKVTQDREIVVIERRGADSIAMVAADELDALLETAHLLRSPKNAERLLTALNRALRNEGQPQSLDDLRAEVGLADKT